MEVVLDHGHALPEPDDVVVAGHEVDALVVHLAGNGRKKPVNVVNWRTLLTDAHLTDARLAATFS